MKKIYIMFIMAFAFSMFFAKDITVNAKGADVISDGVFVETVNVSGMTMEQAKSAVEEYIATLDEVAITLNVMEDKTIKMTAGELGLTWDNQDILEEAVGLGKRGNLIKRYKEKKDLEAKNKVFQVKFKIDKEGLALRLTESAEKYNQNAENAGLKREDGKFVITDGKEGRIISIDESVEVISNYMINDWSHNEDQIDLVIKKEEPQGNKEDLLKVKDVLGTFTTSYSTSGSSRTGNVTNGSRLIDGTTLYPGEIFSTYEKVSPFSEDNGYYMAGSYLNGMVVDSLGGGICQVSTTLYNAVLNSELEVTERFNHSMIVSYVDPSADAAIAGTAKDFKFKNNTDYPIYIEGYTTSDKKITFNIYGVEYRKPTHSVTYESEVLTTTPPEPEKIIQDPAQPVGYIDVQSAHVGYTAKLWKVVKEDGVEVSRTEENRSTYKQAPRTATVGVASPDPNVYNAMQEAIATGSIDHVRNVVAAYKAEQARVLAEAQNQAQPPQPQEQPQP